MPDARYDFAAVDAIDAESIGTPGKRTFRLRILRRGDAAALWVEKQQLAALGEALPRLLDQLDTPDQHADEPPKRSVIFPRIQRSSSKLAAWRSVCHARRPARPGGTRAGRRRRRCRLKSLPLPVVLPGNRRAR